MIQLQGIHLQRGAKILLENADLTIHPGQKWGLIGANGSGKSSLFRLLLGELHEDAGRCSVPQHWQIAHMAQEVAGTDKTALDYVIDGDDELRQLQRAIDAAQGDSHQAGNTLAALYEQMENIHGYAAESRAQKLLHGLGFANDQHQRAVKHFSGGWRIRLNLARALMCRSDLLLLDEPTNHLDLDATLWLEQWLQSYPGTLLIISHDRDFLDNVVGNIASVEAAALSSYSGNYSAYERQRAERLALQQAAYKKQQERIAEMEDFVRRFRAKASKAKQAQSRLKALERMETIAQAHIDSPFTFGFYPPQNLPQTLITLSEAELGYGDCALVRGLELSILGTTRVGLLGHNGAGKSTLIKTLAGEIAPLAGTRVEGNHLRLGYFSQHQLEALDLDASCALHLQRLTPKASEQEVRNFLGSFDFRGDRAFECIRHFSGGEKARLALAIVVWQKPNLLLLDEPTNHLDLEMRHALTVALQAFEGALVLVSHDRHLLKNTVDSFLLVDAGKVENFDGTLEDYQRWLATAESRPASTPASPAAGAKMDKKSQRQQAAALRDALKPLTNTIKKLEREMEALQAQLDRLNVQLANPTLYEADNAELAPLLTSQAQAQRTLAEKEEQWMENCEALETLQQGRR